jgi:hypothetical protein
MQIVKKKSSKIFIDQWKESLNSETNKQGNMGNKLRTYRKFKTYLNLKNIYNLILRQNNKHMQNLE